VLHNPASQGWDSLANSNYRKANLVSRPDTRETARRLDTQLAELSAL